MTTKTKEVEYDLGGRPKPVQEETPVRFPWAVPVGIGFGLVAAAAFAARQLGWLVLAIAIALAPATVAAQTTASAKASVDTKIAELEEQVRLLTAQVSLVEAKGKLALAEAEAKSAVAIEKARADARVEFLDHQGGQQRQDQEVTRDVRLINARGVVVGVLLQQSGGGDGKVTGYRPPACAGSCF